METGLSRKAWRYINHYGDALFNFIWKIKPRDESLFKVAIKYLCFLANSSFPPPPSPIIIKALLNMQGYEDGNEFTFPSNWRELDSPIIKMALHYYGQIKEVSSQHVDDLLLVAYRELDYGIELDKNQNKRGWRWLVNKCKFLDNEIIKQVKLENLQWSTTINTTQIDGYLIKEIQNHYELCCTASLMRNCLNTYDDKCSENEMRFFSVHHPDINRPVAVIGLNHFKDGWQLGEMKGFANTNITPELEYLGGKIQKEYNNRYSQRQSLEQRH